jgi:hypothetical protein
MSQKNLRRGFLRLWTVATGIWIAGWVWHYAEVCRDPKYSVVFISGFRCSESLEAIAVKQKTETTSPSGPVTVGPEGFGRPEPYNLEEIGAIEIVITLLGIPLAIPAMGWLTAWVVRGFRPN